MQLGLQLRIRGRGCPRLQFDCAYAGLITRRVSDHSISVVVNYPAQYFRRQLQQEPLVQRCQLRRFNAAPP